MTVRYAVLVQERPEGGMFSSYMAEPSKKRVAYLIKSADDGRTWEVVNSESETDVRKLTDALNRYEQDNAVAALRYEIDGGIR